MNIAEFEPLEKLQDPVKTARDAGLRYVTDVKPGISRQRNGKGFRFVDARGKAIKDDATLKRIRSLAIPPAWTDVWICSDSSGHLQATGRDDRKRKQFRYHPRWREVRDETKYVRMIVFAKALPIIRRRVEKHLALPGLPREKVLATVVRLLEVSLIRVGNAEYAKANDSFGLTTMRDKHVNIQGPQLKFSFRGKSGKWHDINIRDRRLATIVQNCQEIPGHELFQYFDETGARRDVRSDDVNTYLREISGENFTAKDFRTWAGTVLAAMALREFKRFDTKAQARKNVVAAIESVAQRLGNTPAVCRKCYVHPQILDSYLDGTLATTIKRRAEKELAAGLHNLQGEEAAVLALLQQRLSVEEQLTRSLSKERKVRSTSGKAKRARTKLRVKRH